MKLWVDDVRPAPEGYIWAKSVNQAKSEIRWQESRIADKIQSGCTPELVEKLLSIEVIDIDHDAGDYVSEGGDYIKLLDWLEETGRNYPIRVHSMNPVGKQNMLAICQHNGWKIIY